MRAAAAAPPAMSSHLRITDRTERPGGQVSRSPERLAPATTNNGPSSHGIGVPITSNAQPPRKAATRPPIVGAEVLKEGRFMVAPTGLLRTCYAGGGDRQ